MMHLIKIVLLLFVLSLVRGRPWTGEEMEDWDEDVLSNEALEDGNTGNTAMLANGNDGQLFSYNNQ